MTCMTTPPGSKIDLPDDLFGDTSPPPSERKPPSGTRSGDRPSAGFMTLVGQSREKMDRRKSKPKTMAAAIFNRALTEVDEMLRSGDWTGAGTRHLVALYDRMHLRCYGVEAVELGPSERFQAGMQASNMLKRHFADDLVSMVDYMLWAWNREIDRERYRRQHQQDGGRLGFRLMFGGHLLSDYRCSLARRGVRT